MYADVCPTCMRKAHSPFRVWNGGKVVNGCVDEFHTGHLTSPSESSFWHNRPAAKKIRGNMKAMRNGYVTKLA